MKGHNFLALLSIASYAVASPFSTVSRNAKRQTQAPLTDADILQYALTLEHLEATFYRQGLANFTAAEFATAGYDDMFYKNLQDVAAHEAAHVDFLVAGLKAAGATPVKECTYAFGVTDIDSFVITASILEGVGVAAYLGAAGKIASKDYLAAAGSILTVESRHNAYIRDGLDLSPFPQAQDNPLTPNMVFTLAAPFIVSCPPKSPALPLKAFPPLSITTSGQITNGQTINVMTGGYVLAPANMKAQLYASFITANGPIFTELTPEGDGMNFKAVVPPMVYGQSYLVLCNCNETVTDDTVVAGPALVEITKKA